MEDNEVLFENDPLAVYIKNLNIPYDVELTVNEIQLENERKNSDKNYKLNISRCIKYNRYEVYRQEILKSELLFNDDCSVLQAYYTDMPTKRNSIIKIFSYISLTAIGTTFMLYPVMPIRNLIGSICLAPSVWLSYNMISKYFKRNDITKLVTGLKDFTNLTKKCLRLLVEYSMTLNYYTSVPSESSLYIMLMHFSQYMYSYLLEATNLLRYKSIDLLLCVPLTVELPYLEKINVVENVKINDVKMQYEYYLLTQSHFLKVLGLTFCPNLWKTEDSDFKMIFSTLIPTITAIIPEKVHAIKCEYNSMKNYGIIDKTIRPPKKFKNLALSNMYTSLQTAELHYHQLLCKVQDAQKILSMCDFTSDRRYGAEDLVNILTELDSQMENPRHYINSAMITLNRLLQNDMVLEERLYNLNSENVSHKQSQIVPPAPPLPIWEPEPPRGNEVFELFIPKEGLAPIVEDSQEDNLCLYKDYEYSGTLLEELKMLLKERNPDIVAEEEKLAEVHDKDEDECPPLPVIEIFKPQQPVGFTSNALNDLLAARQQMQNEEECFGDENDESFED